MEGEASNLVYWSVERSMLLPSGLGISEVSEGLRFAHKTMCCHQAVPLLWGVFDIKSNGELGFSMFAV